MNEECLRVNSEGIELRALDFGGREADDFLLLHGLAGRGSEWRSTAKWLTEHGRVIALDQRGHGESRSGVGDFCRESYVRDAISTIEQCCSPPVVVIGQSMGALNAFLVAAARPDLVKRLIVVEGTPEPDPKAQQNVRKWLEGWPVPFESLQEAREYFGGDTLYASTFAEELEKDDAGYWPAFDIEDMVRSLDDMTSTHYWSEWGKVTCPTLIVGGENSFISQALLKEMVKQIPDGRYVCIPNAGHDLHLDKPEEWRRVVEAFLEEQK